MEIEELQKKVENLESALNFERTEKKRLAKELATSKVDDSKAIADEEAKIRESLKNGKAGLNDDVIEDIMNSIGKSQARANVNNAKQSVEKEIMELKRNPLYMDVEEHGDEIRAMIKNGMSAEQAYWAINGATKYSSQVNEQEMEAKKEETKERAKEGYVSGTHAGAEEKPTYSAKERAIADTLNISAEEAKARSKNSFSLDEILNMNKKFKKGE